MDLRGSLFFAMHHTRWRVFGGAFVGMLAAIGLLGISGCSKRSEAATTNALVAPPLGPALESPLESPSVSAIENPNYAARISLAGPCRKGQTCIMHVELQAKGEYHINDKYPYRFKVQDPPAEGVKYPKPAVGRENGSFEEKKAVLDVPFIVEGSGSTASVGGTLSLSVCSAANCLVDKQSLEVTAKVD
jgi:hypothetical protein